MEDQVFINVIGERILTNIDSFLFDFTLVIAISLAGAFLFQLMWMAFFGLIRNLFINREAIN